MVCAFALAAVALAGCESAFDRHRRELGELHAQGRYDLAAQSLDSPANRELYGERNELLFHLDRGAAALAAGDRQAALDRFSDAERIMDERRGEDAGDVLGALLVNDTLRRYVGEPYEDIYANVFKILAQLELGRVQGGATVEARRMAVKANALRDEYLRLVPAVRERGGEGAAASHLGALSPATSEGQFVESTLGLFLAAVTFMHSGDSNDQAVAARRLTQIIQAQREIIGPAEPRNFEGIGDRAPESGDVLLVAFSGRGPRKEPFRLPPFIVGNVPIYTEVPVLRWRPSRVAAARVIVDGKVHDLDFVESLAQVANENHKRQLPLTYARTFARAAAKSAGVYFGSKAAERAGGRGAEIGVLLGGLALMIATEKADLRCWELLPGQAHVRLLRLPPGEHRVRVEWLGAGGGVIHASPETTLRVPGAASESQDSVPGGEPTLNTIVEYYWE